MIQFGNNEIKEIYVGSDKVKEVYYGSDLVYQAIKDHRSWWVSTSGVKSYFDLENTPITNFNTSASTVVINSSSIQKTTIKELVFGDSYKNVTDIGNFFLYNCSALTSLDLSAFSNVTSIGFNFLYGCSKLTSLDLSAFSNVTSIGAHFLRNCSKLTSLDLSAFSNVTSIGAYFLYYCTALTQFKIGAVNVPTTSASGFLQNTIALTTILVPMQSVQAYETTAPWSDHASKISAIPQEGYWIHKDTGVKTYFGADADFINNGVMGRPDWLFDAVEIKLCSGINDFELTEVDLGGETGYVCLVFVDINFETGEGGNDVLQSIDMSNTLVNTLGFYTFYYCTSLTSITLPDGLTSIGGGAFTSCTSLPSITLPDSLTIIEFRAFAQCTSLSLVTSLPTIPPSLGNTAFGNTSVNLIIKVPAQSVDAYKTATNWNSYANKISAI